MTTKKTKLFTMKMTPAEKEKYHDLAKSHGISLAEFVREKLEDEKPKRKAKIISCDPQLLREINAIGNNINQIARKINEGEKFEVLLELSSIEKKLGMILDAHQIH